MKKWISVLMMVCFISFPNLSYANNSTKTSKVLVATAYTPSVKECGPNPLITASGSKVRPGIIAVSRDLYKSGWTFGKRVKINGKIYIIEDLMHSSKKNMIDIFMNSRTQALEFGKQKINITLLD